ncbi:potassium voltage-gated channel subfamily E member 2-like [Rana temporaria]|uniref:potassium voltage-gated channel subfamily E member 2-like n=1 Tax=Rana temporaria TaxID=8407 RepID=UPI001AADA16F|nr:potassium voltage-gated channel subfamily E member 2-like [Rana temporaria]XP_040195628.1 potassium voltage-gated channel subfamily E member 2-like [Rana temporaria]XP_040195629.1 potassium voltage-gated channel subfamily E member 2-like [Rana temporaria]XP_040195630.1 potassium voltage-gated channel subfamily E member 2-like [Rana temporaria]
MYVSANFTQTIENAFKKVFENYMNSVKNNQSIAAKQLKNTLEEENFNFVILYLMVMIGMFSFIIVAILVSTTRSKRHKTTDELDPYSRYIETDFNKKGVGVTLENPAARSYSAPLSP